MDYDKYVNLSKLIVKKMCHLENQLQIEREENQKLRKENLRLKRLLKIKHENVYD